MATPEAYHGFCLRSHQVAQAAACARKLYSLHEGWCLRAFGHGEIIPPTVFSLSLFFCFS